MKKLRARDKSDADVKFKLQGEQIHSTSQDILKYHDYFNCMAQAISILTENVNMQMEADNSDLLDRRLMALYGVTDNKPTKMDIAGTLTKKMTNKKGLYRDNQSNDAPTQATGTHHQGSKNDLQHNFLQDTSSRVSSEDRAIFTKDGSVEQYLDAHIPRIDSVDGSRGPPKDGDYTGYDNIRQISGGDAGRHDLPIKINQQCLAHQT